MTQVALGSFMGPKIIRSSKDCNNIISHISAARHSVANNYGKKIVHGGVIFKFKIHWTLDSCFNMFLKIHEFGPRYFQNKMIHLFKSRKMKKRDSYFW